MSRRIAAPHRRRRRRGRDGPHHRPRSRRDRAGDVDIVAGRSRRRRRRARLAQALPAARPGGRSRCVASRQALARALAGAHVLVNACHHDFNLRGDGRRARDRRALLRSRRAVPRHEATAEAAREFRARGCWRCCGIGIGARHRERHGARGGRPHGPRARDPHRRRARATARRREGASLLDTSYSILTVLDEASQPAALFTGGQADVRRAAEPARCEWTSRQPVGTHGAGVHAALGGRDAAGVVPREGRARGQLPHRVSGELIERLRFVHALGLTSTTPVAHRRPARSCRASVLLALAGGRAEGQGDRPARRVRSAARDRARPAGRPPGRPRSSTATCPACRRGTSAWTSTPAPAVDRRADARVADEITARGVLPPEQAIPAASFFRARSPARHAHRADCLVVEPQRRSERR